MFWKGQTMVGFLESLRSQHAKDLALYRRSHQERKNRVIHWVMIPVEFFSFHWFAAIVSAQSVRTQHFVVATIGLTTGVFAVIVNTDMKKGGSVFLFHLLSCPLVIAMTSFFHQRTSTMLACSLWTIAWAMQVIVGHYICEKNQPNLANPKEISSLSVILSVLISWSS